MALTSTIYTFDIGLSNVDRGVYEALNLRVAQHPSESEEYLVTRLMAYCLEYEEGIVFSKGISDPEDPPVAIRDLTGALKAWIEIGAPDADRLHKASKAAPRVALYTHKDPAVLRRQYAGARIHKSQSLKTYAMDRELLAWFIARLDRRMAFTFALTDGALFVTVGEDTWHGTIPEVSLFEG